ncbi:MAG: L,D-transpeptidase, partial [Cyanobacteria bacterium P01_F01_bin.4]
ALSCQLLPIYLPEHFICQNTLMLSDQQPITRCFVLLCFSTAMGLLVFEWSDPLALREENVVVTSLSPLSVLAADPPGEPVSAQAAAVVGNPLEADSTNVQSVDAQSAAQASANPSPRKFAAARPTKLRLAGRRPRVAQTSTEPTGQSQEPSGNRPDAKAAIPRVPLVEVRVKLAMRQVELYKQGKLVEQYPVAVGQDEWETPVGVFEVLQMQQNPAWQHPITQDVIEPGPDNPLGARWIGFWSDGTSQIGFHGTNQENLIGQAVSHGCIRMRNQDIQKLYDQLALGTLITVEP